MSAIGNQADEEKNYVADDRNSDSMITEDRTEDFLPSHNNKPSVDLSNDTQVPTVVETKPISSDDKIKAAISIKVAPAKQKANTGIKETKKEEAPTIGFEPKRLWILGRR